MQSRSNSTFSEPDKVEFIKVAVFLAMVSVFIGAFGTHVLKQVLKFPPDKIEIFSMANYYQMIHCMWIVFIFLYRKIFPVKKAIRCLDLSNWFYFLGIILFCFSLYLYVCFDLKPLVRVVPIGGMCFAIGHLLFFINLCFNLNHSKTK